MELTASDIKNFIKNSVFLLEAYKDKIDSINVFPVADKDTGSNIYNTIKRIWDKIENIEINHAGKLLREIANIAISEAQGNSGNILAMFFYGISEVLENKGTITIKDLKEAFKLGYQYAKEAVAKPKKGTILTVMETLSNIFNREEGELNNLLKKAIKNGLINLKKYSKFVDKLKENKVIDAGGLGFIIILKAWLRSLGDDIKINLEKYFKKNVKQEKNGSYCINILAEIKRDINNLLEEISKFESVVVKQIGDKLKLHVHHEDPKVIVEVLEKYGKIIKIEYTKI